MHKKFNAAKEKKILEESLLRLVARGGPTAPAAVEALRHLKDGGYGICSDCNKPIPQARMRAVPEATRCVNCQHEREQRSAA